MQRLFHLWILYLFFSTTCIIAQHTIQIVDSITQTPISEVFVYDEKQQIQEVSNEKGQILLKNIDTTTFLLFQHASYQFKKAAFSDIQAQDFTVFLEKANIVLPETMVTANRVREKRFEITNKIQTISATQIVHNNSGTSADLLDKAGNVFIQRSQAGGGSPVIRGLEANKVLIVLDGIRMNNAIYRGGHVQNVITIDPMMLEKVEVVYGPGSVIYGSDALGGVMHFTTKKSQLTKDTLPTFDGNTYLRYTSANKGTSLHLDFNWGFEKWASLTSITYSQFGDLRIGEQRSGAYPTWGLRPEYIDQINGQDTILQNDNPLILRQTGYNQTDLLQKIRYQLQPHQQFNVNLQYSTTSNIPRFDRLNDYNDGRLKFAEWAYGPQDRLLFSLQFVDEKKRRFHENITWTAAFQQIEESRIRRKYQSSIRSSQIEEVQIYSLNGDAVKSFSPKHRLQYGLEATLNNIQSTAFEEDITNAEIQNNIPTRYPDGDNQTQSYSIYSRHKWHLAPQWIWTNGLRYTYQRLEAAYQDSSDYHLPYNSISDQHSAMTFSSGLLFNPNERSKFAASISSGFRSPNLDDVAKFFDPADANVVVPNADVKPEYAYNGELSWEQQINERLYLNADVYGMYLVDLIRRERFDINGQDSIVFEGTLSEVYANTNAAKAMIYGAAFSLQVEVLKGLVLSKNFSYTKGRDLTDDVPLGHIPPIFGNLKLAYQSPKSFSFFGEVRYNGWKRLSDYSPNNEDKVEEATLDGTPAWAIVNMGFSYSLKERLLFNVVMENVLDVHYKPFASGVSGPGRNLVLSLKYGW